MLRYRFSLFVAGVVGLILSGCGGGSGGGSTTASTSGGSGSGSGSSETTTFAPGVLVGSPTQIDSLTPDQLTAKLTAQGVPALAINAIGTPKCTVNYYRYTFTTKGAANEEVTSTGAVIVPSLPSGSADTATCTGSRPVLLYAHGTTPDKNFDMASPDTKESTGVVGVFASRGYIVVAPNYAGYGASTLPYHPYLIMDQQSGEMIHAWSAIKASLPAGATSNGKLFISGYSQGGHVAMATQRAMELAGTPPTATAPLSGPYALGQYADAVFGGRVNVGAVEFAPLLLTAAQKAYGNVYGSSTSTAADAYESTYATGIETLLPSTTAWATLLANGQLPSNDVLFAPDTQSPAGTYGFGTPNLLKTSYRAAYLSDVTAHPYANYAVSPANPVRAAAYKNDLLMQNWTPTSPMLLCGGNADPMVFYEVNTTQAQAYFASKGASSLVTVLDVDSGGNPLSLDPFEIIKFGFAQVKATPAIAQQIAVKGSRTYHADLVPPFCYTAARQYFNGK